MTSQGYLTAGLAARIAEIQGALELLEQVSDAPARRVVSGVVVVTEADEERMWMLLPGGDGATLCGVTVISPQSPVGLALLGRVEGDEVMLPSGEAEVTSVT